MTTDQIEMLWKCGDSGCAHENRGRDHVCARCGRPKADEDGCYLPGDISHAAAVTDPAMLRAALAGADWRCRYCTSMQRRLDGACAQCGADQATGEVKAPPEPERAASPAPPIRRDHAYLRGRSHWLGILLLAFAIPAALWAIFRTREYDVTVASVEWEAVVHVERYAPEAREGFDPDVGAVDVRDEGTRIHHFDHVRTGSHEEAYEASEACGKTCSPVPRTCRTTSRSCRSNKNGFATCTGGDQVCSGGGQSCSARYCSVTRHRSVDDYTDVPRFRDYYGWTLWRWTYARDAKRAGSDVSPDWPDPAIAPNERESGRAMFLHVHFAQGGDTWTYEPPSAGDLRRFPPGSKHRIRASLASVTVIQ